MDLATAHQNLVETTWSGFTFLLANGVGWLVIGLLAFRVKEERVALVVLLMGLITMPMAFGLRSVLGLPPYDPANPLNRLGLLLAFVPAAAFPAILIAYLRIPRYMPCVVAAILGGHFLPYAWLYQTPIYLYLGVAVAVVPSLLLVYGGRRGFALGPLLVGVMLVLGAGLVV